MEVKKSPQADLENKKNIFLEIGLMLALGTILFAFEWKVSGRQPADFVTVSEIPTEIEMVPTPLSPLPYPKKHLLPI
jgi:periplasmic protein TonB